MLRGQYRWLLLRSAHDVKLSRYENITFPQAATRHGSDDITGERLPVKAYRGFIIMNLVVYRYRHLPGPCFEKHFFIR
jgi:hypothetical protein